MLLMPLIKKGVPWARIEARDFRGVARQEGEVRHPADIEHRLGIVFRGQQSAVEGGHEGCALPPGRHISAAEIRHHGDARALRDAVRVADL